MSEASFLGANEFFSIALVSFFFAIMYYEKLRTLKLKRVQISTNASPPPRMHKPNATIILKKCNLFEK